MRVCRNRSVQRQGGYMLLILMFFVALIAFSMMAVLPRVVQQVKRDREEEMIHRGTEYARAVKKYYKKFNKYPNSLQDLENTNNLRFLRKRYKDPLSKDGTWKLLSVADVQQGVTNPNFGVSQAGNFNPAQGGLGAQPGGTGPQPGGIGAQSGGFGQQIGPGGGQQPPAFGPTDGGQSGGQPQAGGTPTGGGVTSQGGASTTGDTSGGGDASGGNPANPTGTGLPGNPATGGQTGQTYGAGGIVGVESVNKSKTIREFGGKHNYNKWMFIYDPTQDKGTLLRGPYNPQAFQGGGGTVTNGQPGQPGQPGQLGQPGQPGQQPQGPGQNMPPDVNAPPQ